MEALLANPIGPFILAGAAMILAIALMFACVTFMGVIFCAIGLFFELIFSLIWLIFEAVFAMATALFHLVAYITRSIRDKLS